MHRCNLAEVGGAVSGPGVGEGGTAAVIVRDGATLGLLYIRWVPLLPDPDSTVLCAAVTSARPRPSATS